MSERPNVRADEPASFGANTAVSSAGLAVDAPRPHPSNMRTRPPNPRPRTFAVATHVALLGLLALVPLRASADEAPPRLGEDVAAAAGAVGKDCTFNGIPLHGKVKVVEAFADVEVKVVTAFPDLKVKVVDAFPDRCGEWKFVESFPDFTIKYVDAFADVEVRHVEAFPGVP